MAHIRQSRPDSGLGFQIKDLDTGEISRGKKMLYSGTDPESYINEYTLVYEDRGFECVLLLSETGMR